MLKGWPRQRELSLSCWGLILRVYWKIGVYPVVLVPMTKHQRDSRLDTCTCWLHCSPVPNACPTVRLNTTQRAGRASCLKRVEGCQILPCPVVPTHCSLFAALPQEAPSTEARPAEPKPRPVEPEAKPQPKPQPKVQPKPQPKPAPAPAQAPTTKPAPKAAPQTPTAKTTASETSPAKPSSPLSPPSPNAQAPVAPPSPAASATAAAEAKPKPQKSVWGAVVAPVVQPTKPMSLREIQEQQQKEAAERLVRQQVVQEMGMAAWSSGRIFGEGSVNCNPVQRGQNPF